MHKYLLLPCVLAVIAAPAVAQTWVPLRRTGPAPTTFRDAPTYYDSTRVSWNGSKATVLVRSDGMVEGGGWLIVTTEVDCDRGTTRGHHLRQYLPTGSLLSEAPNLDARGLPIPPRTPQQGVTHAQPGPAPLRQPITLKHGDAPLDQRNGHLMSAMGSKAVA